MTYSIRAYYWNPNGTNDAEILNDEGYVVESIQEAFFGLNLPSQRRIISLNTALKHIAVSPVSDGSEVVNVLSKYFKSINGGI